MEKIGANQTLQCTSVMPELKDGGKVWEDPQYSLKRQNNKGIWVYCAGVFDLLHSAHVKYLKFAKSLGDTLVVGLVEDDAVARYKEHRPIMSYSERFDVLKAIRCVDYVVRQNDTDPTDTLTKLRDHHSWIFDIMVRGDDYDGVPPGSQFIEYHGGKVVRSQYDKSVSSTNIKKRILDLYG